jgi:hypothetical protein
MLQLRISECGVRIEGECQLHACNGGLTNPKSTTRIPQFNQKRSAWLLIWADPKTKRVTSFG